MKFALLTLLLPTLVTAAESRPTAAAETRPIAYAELEGTINPGSAAFLKDAVERATQMQAQALVIRLDTPGGLLSSTRDIVRIFSTATLPIVIFIGPGGARATSAGAIMTVAAHYAAMAPGTNIGAAAPVGQGGKDIEGDMAKKAKNDTAAMVRSQATLRGRDAAAAEKMVLESLSHSPAEAVKLKIVDAEAKTLGDVLQSLDGREFLVGEKGEKVKVVTTGLDAASLARIEMTLPQRFLHFVADPNISTILMAVGGMAIYAEVSSGFSLVFPGLIGLFCLLLAFVSLQMLPVNIGGLALLVLGFVLLLAEAFVTSFGLLAVGGVASIAIGALFLVDTSLADIQVSLSLLIPILAGIAFVTGVMAYLLTRERTGKVFDLVLGQAATVETVAADGRSGTALVAGEIWKFTSDTAFAPGDKAEVTGKNGLILRLAK